MLLFALSVCVSGLQLHSTRSMNIILDFYVTNELKFESKCVYLLCEFQLFHDSLTKSLANPKLAYNVASFRKTKKKKK